MQGYARPGFTHTAAQPYASLYKDCQKHGTLAHLFTIIQLFPTLLSDFQVVDFFLQNRAKMCQDLLGFARDQHAQEGLH